MDMISLQGKTNFFEKRVGDYQRAGVKITDNAADNSRKFNFGDDEDFWKVKWKIHCIWPMKIDGKPLNASALTTFWVYHLTMKFCSYCKDIQIN